MRIRSMDFYNTNRCVVISYESSTSKHIIVETDEQVSFTYIHLYIVSLLHELPLESRRK